VITSFLNRRLVNHLIITVAPMFVGGKPSLQGLHTGTPDSGDGPAFPELDNIQYQWLGKDLVIQGDPSWPDA
jgi:3,4-dihydroxy 2-butanone 4-phosphate synthase/GTP cyclohydrolase II